jgi:hypothetical protein
MIPFAIWMFSRGIHKVERQQQAASEKIFEDQKALLDGMFSRVSGIVGETPDMIKALIYMNYLTAAKEIIQSQIGWYEGRFFHLCACAREASFDGNFFLAGKIGGPFIPHPELNDILQRFGDGFNTDQWAHPPSKLLDQAMTVRAEFRDNVNKLLKEATAATAKMRFIQSAIDGEIIKVGNKVTEYGKGQ